MLGGGGGEGGGEEEEREGKDAVVATAHIQTHMHTPWMGH